MPKRTRGYILTPKSAKKLQDAKREWECQHSAGCTEEKMRELTSPFKENGLDPGTIRGILNGDERKDKKSICCLFSAFNLQLEEDDLTSEPQACLPKLDPNFLGREEAIADLDTFVSQGAKVICIYGKGGVGKTTLARKYLSTRGFDLVLEPPMAKETKNITPIESVVEELLRDLQGEPARDFGITLKRLKQQLKTQRVGVLIDNLEPALDKDGKFIEPHRAYLELLSILAAPDVQSVTLITSRECLKESRVTVKPYELKGLNEDAWRQYSSSRDLATDSSALSEMWKAYGGNAKAMEILCSAIQKDYEGDLEVYWQVNQGDLLIEKELEDLVKSQFDRLEKHDFDAYRLLCRLGCYRYQEVPSVPTVGVLRLLWDLPEEQHKRVIKSLRDRSLVEFHHGEYWLHPVIQEEARVRLGKTLEFKLANLQATTAWIILIEEKYGKNNKLIGDCLHLQFFYHYLQCLFDSEQIQEEERCFGKLVPRKIELAYIYAEFRYYTGLVLQHFEKHYIKQLKIKADVRKNFQGAIIIFNLIGDTERSEKVQRIMENGADIYDYAEAYYQLGLINRDEIDLEKTNFLFKMAIHLFKEIEAHEEAEKVRRAMESGE
jgi:tetratricopeptide (TPR) repeat protein